MKPNYYHSSDFGFDQRSISPAALDVVEGLQQAGFDGYLVGGCVRDLLFGKAPKDFDVTTNGLPEEVRGLFRRARIIGRRFRIVHVRFGREVIEVATYRTNPNKKKKGGWWRWGRGSGAVSGRILDDNVYGTMEDDAYRRDFTANAIYYDPFSEQVVDFVGGVEDIRRNQLNMIGQPTERFIEDPVRMLRVIRFQAKLGIEPESALADAIEAQQSLINDVPPARLFDEVLKLFHHAHGVESWNRLHESGMDAYLFPQTFKAISERPSLLTLVRAALENTDRRVAQDKPVIPAFLFSVLLWQPFVEQKALLASEIGNYGELVWKSGDIVFSEQCQRVAIPRRVSIVSIEIWLMQGNLERRKPRSIMAMMSNRRFRAAYDFLLLRSKIGEVGTGLVDWWTRIQDANDSTRLKMIADLKPDRKRSPKSSKRFPRKRRAVS